MCALQTTAQLPLPGHANSGLGVTVKEPWLVSSTASINQLSL